MTGGATSTKFTVMKAERDQEKGSVVSVRHGGRRAGAGRHPKVISAAELGQLCRLQVTMREAAAFFGMSVSTFHSHLHDNPELAAAWEAGRQNGLVSLRRLQWQAAERGNTALLIFLGKAYLGQSDQSSAGEMIWPEWDLEKLTVAELETLLVLQQKATGTEVVGSQRHEVGDHPSDPTSRVPAPRQLRQL